MLQNIAAKHIIMLFESQEAPKALQLTNFIKFRKHVLWRFIAPKN